ncbi:ac146-like [Fopius arisanus]|nr:ac146-like [Fopius arisanus]
MAEVIGTIIVNPFILNSTSCELYVLYLIALDIDRRCRSFLLDSGADKKFVEVADLQVFIHDGAFTSIEYRATQGHGYRLPRIENE